MKEVLLLTNESQHAIRSLEYVLARSKREKVMIDSKLNKITDELSDSKLKKKHLEDGLAVALNNKKVNR